MMTTTRDPFYRRAVTGVRRSAAGLGVVAAATAFGLAFTTPAAATAVFSASAFAKLTITGITGGDPSELLIDSSTDQDLSTDAIGAIGTFASAAVDAEFVDPVLEQSASVSGEAVPAAAPGSLATAFGTTDGFLSFFNTSDSATFTVNFTFEWATAAAASDDAGAQESAFAQALVQLTGFFFSGDDVDEGNLFEQIVDADTETGDPGESLFGSFGITVTILPFDIYLMSLSADATGQAASVAVPVAGTLPLTAAGLFGLGVLGRAVRRRA